MSFYIGGMTMHKAIYVYTEIFFILILLFSLIIPEWRSRKEKFTRVNLWIISCITIAILLFFMFQINPQTNDFIHSFMDGGKYAYEDMIMVKDIETAIINTSNYNTIIERKNYILFSIFIIPSSSNSDYRILGIGLWYLKLE